MHSINKNFFLLFNINKIKIFIFINSLLASFILNYLYLKYLGINILIPNYISGLPVNFNFLLGYPFFVLKIYIFTLIIFLILLYLEKKIYLLLGNKSFRAIKFANYLFLLSNFSYLINIANPKIFYGPSIDKIINFSYVHLTLILLIFFYHQKFKPFVFNLKNDFFYFKIILSISCLFIIQYLLSFFVQDYLIWNSWGIAGSNKYLSFFLKHTDFLFLLGAYFFLLFFNKYKGLYDYYFFIVSIPLTLKLSFIFSFYAISLLILFFWLNFNYKNNQKIYYFSFFIFIINLFLPLHILLGHSSGFNYLHQGMPSIFVLLSNEFATNYGISFGFFSDYLQSLVPFKLFGISIEVLSYSVIFCRLFEIILCLIIILELFGLKITFLFLLLTISNIFNFFPTDFTTPWTHEYRLLPFYIFIYNFYNFIKYKTHDSFIYLGLSIGYFLLASTADFIIPLIGLIFILILYFRINKNNFKIVKKKKSSHLIFNFVNLFFLFFILNTLNFLYFVKFLESHSFFYSFIVSIIILSSFYFISKIIKQKFFKFLFAFFFITLYWLFFSYTEYSLDLISFKSQYEFQKLVAGYQEIARNYKPSAILVYDYFKTGLISNELMNVILSMNFASNKFSFSNFIYFNSYIFFFVIIAFIYTFFFFNRNHINYFSNNNISILFIVFIASIFSFFILIKYHLLPDNQRFMIGSQFYHLSLFFFIAFFIKNFFFKKIYKIIIFIFFYTFVPNVIIMKPESFYTNPQYGGVKNFAYNTSFVGELSNHYKTISIKNYHTAPFSIKKGVENMINLTEHTYGLDTYQEMKEEMDIFFKFKFTPKNLNDNSIPLWKKNKIVNKFYLE